MQAVFVYSMLRSKMWQFKTWPGSPAVPLELEKSWLWTGCWRLVIQAAFPLTLPIMDFTYSKR